MKNNLNDFWINVGTVLRTHYGIDVTYKIARVEKGTKEYRVPIPLPVSLNPRDEDIMIPSYIVETINLQKMTFKFYSEHPIWMGFSKRSKTVLYWTEFVEDELMSENEIKSLIYAGLGIYQ